MKPTERQPPTTKPTVMQLDRRRRQVLYLRAYGWDYEQIAARLGVPRRVVHKDLVAVGRKLVPTGKGIPPATKQPQVMYILGLLDGGVDAADVLAYLQSLPERVRWLEDRTAREAAPTVPVDTTGNHAG